MTIYYTGLKNLSQLKQTRIKTILEKEYPKLKILLKQKAHLKVNIKSYDNTGKRKKFSIHLKIDGAFKPIATKAYDWDLRRATHKAIRNLHKASEHRYKIETNPLHCVTRQILGIHR